MKLDILRDSSEKKEHCTRTKTLSQVIAQLFSFLIFPIIEVSGNYLRKYLRELTET